MGIPGEKGYPGERGEDGNMGPMGKHLIFTQLTE